MRAADPTTVSGLNESGPAIQPATIMLVLRVSAARAPHPAIASATASVNTLTTGDTAFSHFAQPISQKVESARRCKQYQTRRKNEPPRTCKDVALRAREHVAPRRHGRANSDTQVRQRRFRQHCG